MQTFAQEVLQNEPRFSDASVCRDDRVLGRLQVELVG